MTAFPGSHVTLDPHFPSSLHPRPAAAVLQVLEGLGTSGGKLPSAQHVSFHPEDGQSDSLLLEALILRDCLNVVAALERWPIG